ncbi:solute carrier family 20 (sodium-dependent phosphate transporter), partial [Phenoliferia sp. Uapishka_3]
MPALHQYDYIFAFGTIFAALDAYNIGANDVSNSFATSVSSKSLTMRQAVLAASICEFTGAVLVGARVADTIKNGIIPLTVFRDNPGVQILAFTCALVASSIWLMICTKSGFPVSTTYSIIAAVAGVGVAIGGKDAVNWGWNGGKGLATIFAGFLIAPALAAGFASILFLSVKYGVLNRKNPVKWALGTSPFIFGLVGSVMTLSIIYKGAPSLGLLEKPAFVTNSAIVGAGAVLAVLSVVFWLPYVYCKAIRKDHSASNFSFALIDLDTKGSFGSALRWYHFFFGPLLWRRPLPEAPADGAKSHIPDYRHRKDVADESAPEITTERSIEDQSSSSGNTEKDITELEPTTDNPSTLAKEVEEVDLHPIVGDWFMPKNLWIAIRCVASFAHGANDVSNAVGPYAVIYQVWSTGNAGASRAPIPVWLLAVAGGFIVVGLATYGYKIMAVLGNKITMVTPSRGFSMELGAAITIILASQYGIPVSSTMCITGATLGVSLCNGQLGATNWRTLAWIVFGWLLTVPVVGVAAGCLFGIVFNAPHF